MVELIGREKEIEQLRRCVNSEKSEFVIVYGRRRVGKTFLIRKFFNDDYAFYFVGRHNESQDVQLASFADQLKRYSKSTFAPKLKNWDDAFACLRDYLESLPTGRKVIFIDEMPWIDTHKSQFVSALEYFWNSWVATRDDIVLVACGSATSWMADKLLENKGGMHNRITCQIYLRPFTLGEVEKYLESKNCYWDRMQIVQAYMVLGGVPYYYSLINTTQSLAQNIDYLFFEKNAPLSCEFSELYSALFANADRYINVVSILAQKHDGMSRQEIIEATGLSGGNMTKILDNLEKCDFITVYVKFGCKKNNVTYRLTDFYTLFYFRFLHDKRTLDNAFWTHNCTSQAVVSWQGMAFEIVGMTHSNQIKKKLGILGVSTSISAWRNAETQIDMLIDRADRVINLCEFKFSDSPYVISKEYEQKLRMRLAIFKESTSCRKSLVTTFVTTFGVVPGKHSAIAAAEVTMDDLFVND
ncbi:MAG: AAA family ATPase [Salinivirgaceae bacterium]|nr:AAA family ATPase [Salinivirgaceae bacterium]